MIITSMLGLDHVSFEHTQMGASFLQQTHAYENAPEFQNGCT